ncbi:DUF86 domain-containing protein [Candidatus Gottesmanbacteria bacterium]|nr:DUF86 domain-containing protein [Candidatus Gottesmanbacteria bacterium]
MDVKYHTLEQKFERLKEQINRLQEISKEIKSAADLKKDFQKQAVVERLFQIALEALLDIGRMIISIENLPRPQENDEIFQILAEAKIINQEYAKRAFGMGRFRNILVHGYMIIKPQRVFENLQKLDLFIEFTEFVAKYIEKKS